MTSGRSPGPIVFVWDNFGPLHVDRCDAVARRFATRRKVFGVELAGKSEVYGWVPESGVSFQKITLFHDLAIEKVPFGRRLAKTLRACFSFGSGADFFICNYNHVVTLIVATILRLCGRRVYAMGCSKFDDYPRSLKRECYKSLFYLPYCGGISSGHRAKDYMRFLGVKEEMVRTEYNTVSHHRIRSLAQAPAAPEGVPFAERHFTIVARFIPEKNLPMVLSAFAEYARETDSPRSLHLCGSGPLESSLRDQVRASGIEHLVHFRGFIQTAEICRTLATTLAVLLPSVKDTFGNVVPEAQAMGLPVILSNNCGAADLLIRSGVNGFVVEPDNPSGLAYFMKLIAEDERLWTRMCVAAQQLGRHGDTDRFADAVEELIFASKSIPS